MLGLSCSARLARRGSRTVRESWGNGLISWRGQCRDGDWCLLGIRRPFHNSQVVGDKVVVPLPGLGDSIKEGRFGIVCGMCIIEKSAGVEG